MFKAIFLSTRMKSLYWRTSMMVLALVVGVIAQNVDVLAPYISPATIAMLGLIFGEISKGLNNMLSGK